MTMVESNAPHPLEPIFENFEKRWGWKLSPEAKTILREGVNSVGKDKLGLGPLVQNDLRFAASAKVIDLMPAFLDELRNRAEKRSKIETSDRVIGGVFVLQNTGIWQQLFGCSCWPI